MRDRHSLYSLLLALQLVLAGPVRRGERAKDSPVLNEVTFWKDPECQEVNGHMKWNGSNGKFTLAVGMLNVCVARTSRLTELVDWRLVPPGTAAVSLNAVHSGCQIFMCSPDSNCEVQGNAYGPIEVGACNICAITVSLLH